MYTPSNIKKPDEFPQDEFLNPHHLYSGFGKYEYEIIIQRLLEKSQKQGEWISLDPNEFFLLFRDEDRARGYLEEMASTTRILTKNGWGRFELTDDAIGVLAENYPSEIIAD